MLIYQPGFKVVNFVKIVAVFLLFVILNTLIFGQPNDFSLSMYRSESFTDPTAAMDLNAIPSSKNNISTSVAASMRTNRKAYIHESEIMDINLVTRFESIDFSLVKKYAPILNFHPNEGKQCCYPSSAEEAYHRAKSGKTGRYKVPNTLEPLSPCYFEALYTKNGFRIKYWFWYNYNDYPTGPDLWGSHAGDWEYIEVYFENEQPYMYHFSNHRGARIKYLDEVSTINNQVEVWVGSGSHANYESATPQKIYSVLGFPDKVAKGGVRWNTASNLVDVRNTNFYYDSFVNDWGDGNKIYGPLSRMDK